MKRAALPLLRVLVFVLVTSTSPNPSPSSTATATFLHDFGVRDPPS